MTMSTPREITLPADQAAPDPVETPSSAGVATTCRLRAAGRATPILLIAAHAGTPGVAPGSILPVDRRLRGYA